MKILEKAAKANRIRKEKGFRGVKQSLWRFYENFDEKRKYQKWIKAHQITEQKREEIRRQIESFSSKPKISVVMPVYDVEEKWLRLCIESVLNQIYENWELCIADDCSPSPHIKKILEEYTAKDKRIKVVFRAENGHISAASNSALELADGEFVALLDHDDELAEDALFWIAKEINNFPEAAMIYSDEDLIDERGRRYAPKFKPDFSRDLLYSLNLITHLSIYQTEILRKIGGFLLGAEGSQDYDLALRFIEEISENRIRHIPRILYHWRAIRGSVAFSSDEKPYAHERARDALRRHFERTGKRAKVSQAIYNLHRTAYELPANQPKVSLILTADEDSEFIEKSVQNFIEQTDYDSFEIVLILKAEARTSARAEKVWRECALANVRASAFVAEVKIIICKSRNNAEKLNFAAAQTVGEILCLANINLKPLAKNWLTELAGFAVQKEIGAVGAKILERDETVLHGGLIVGTNETVSAAHRGFQREAGGNFLRLQLVNNFSAVSASCLAVRRELFNEIGGFDAENLPNALFDADFCLKLRERHYRIVFTPYAELMKIDAKKRLSLEENPTADEKDYFIEKWSEIIKRDPFYNPNLSKQDASFFLSEQPA